MLHSAEFKSCISRKRRRRRKSKQREWAKFGTTNWYTQ